MARLGIPEAASEAFQREKDVKIYMATRSDLFTPGENLTLLWLTSSRIFDYFLMAKTTAGL